MQHEPGRASRARLVATLLDQNDKVIEAVEKTVEQGAESVLLMQAIRAVAERPGEAVNEIAITRKQVCATCVGIYPDEACPISVEMENGFGGSDDDLFCAFWTDEPRTDMTGHPLGMDAEMAAGPISQAISEAVSEANSEAKPAPKIPAKIWRLEITKKSVPDEDVDLSYLGEFTDRPWYEGVNGNKLVDTARIFDREAEGTQGRGEHQFFVATDQLGETNPKTGKPWARSTRRKYARQQWERAEGYPDLWDCVGLYVEAIVIPEDGSEVWSTRSSGIWNVESDSDKSYFDTLWAEEMAEIREALAEVASGFGLTPEQIEDAIKYAKEV